MLALVWEEIAIAQRTFYVNHPGLSRTVADNVAQGLELLSSTTGVDLASLLKGLTSGLGSGSASGSGSGSGASAKGQVSASVSAAGSAAAAGNNGRIEVAGE